MSGEQQDKQRAIEALKARGLKELATAYWGQPDATKHGGIHRVLLGSDYADVRFVCKVADLPAALNPVTKELAEKAQEAVMNDLDGHFWAEEEIRVRDALGRLIALLFPATPTDANPG